MYSSVYNRIRDVVVTKEEIWKITDFDMEAFMLMSQNQCPGDVSCQGTFPGRQIIVESCKPTANGISEVKDRFEHRPVCIMHWDLRMSLVMIL
jgi:hypothetical protein